MSQQEASEEELQSWLECVAEGGDKGAFRLWNHYFARLVELATAQINQRHQHAYDGEDAAISAFSSFCRRVRNGQYAELEDEQSLWRLLSTMTMNKIRRRIRDHTRIKRGGGMVRGDSVMAHKETATQLRTGSNNFAPSEDLAHEFTDFVESLVTSSDDPSLKKISLMKLSGFSNEEIAQELQCARSTVQRKLALIRASWLEVDTAEE